MAGPHESTLAEAQAYNSGIATDTRNSAGTKAATKATKAGLSYLSNNSGGGGMTDAQRSGGSNVASLYGSGVTAQSGTGANYPAAYFRENQGPTTKSGMLLAALSPTKAMLKEATKTFWNQTKYGMNDAVKTHYDKMVANGLPTGKSVQDVVNDAREAYYVDNPKARGDVRNGDTGGVEIKLENGKSIWISTDDNKVVSGSSNSGSHTVDPDTGDIVEDEVEAEEAKLGEIGLTNVTGPDGRPTWAPTDPNAEGAVAPIADPYAPTWNQAAPQGMLSSQAPQSQASAYELAARQNMLLPQAPQASQAPQAYQAPQVQEQAPQAAPVATGATIPQGTADAGTFRPVTFRSGTGTSTTDADGSITTSLNAPYAGLSGLVGQGSGLLGQAASQAQGPAAQFSSGMDTDQRAQDLFNQRSAMLEPAFAQQNAQARESMFGSGRLGLRLAGEGVGAGSGMVQPDAFGINQAQAQALTGLAAQSSTDAFNQGIQQRGLDANAFGLNQQALQQRYGNLMGAGQGMLQSGFQGAQLESDIAAQQMQAQQNAQNYGLNSDRLALDTKGQAQNFGLAQQTQDQRYSIANRGQNLAELANSQSFGLANRGQNLAELSNSQGYGLNQQQQMQDYGLNQQKMDLATQQQLQDYEMGMLTGDRNYNLQRDVAAQNYELATEGNRIGLITGQAQANKNNYQPNSWLTAGVGLGSAFLGTDAGSDWLSGLNLFGGS